MSSTRSCSSTRASRGWTSVSRAASRAVAFDDDGVTRRPVEADGERVTRARALPRRRERARRLPRHPHRPARARAQPRQGRALRALPRRRPLARGGARATSASTSSTDGLVLVDPVLPDLTSIGARAPRARRCAARPGRRTSCYAEMIDRCRRCATISRGRAHHPGRPRGQLRLRQHARGRRPIPRGGRRGGLRGSDLLERRLHRASARASWPPRRSCRRSPTDASRRVASPATSARCGRGWGPSSRSSTSTTSRPSWTCSSSPRTFLGMVTAVLNVLSGGAFIQSPGGSAPRYGCCSPWPGSTPGCVAARLAGRVAAGVVAVLLRTLRGYAFTIVGIAIGVAGLVALGAMSERIVRFIEGGDRFVLGQISVAGRGMGMGTGFTAGGLLPAPAIRAIAAVPGVAGVQSQVMLPLNPSTSQFMTLTQELVLGLDLAVPMPNRSLSARCRSRPGAPCARAIARVAVVGASFAAVARPRRGRPACPRRASRSRAGGRARAHAHRARSLRHRAHRGRARAVGGQGPAAPHRAGLGRAGPARPRDLNTGAAVGWRDGEDPDAVARRIRDQVAGRERADPERAEPHASRARRRSSPR